MTGKNDTVDGFDTDGENTTQQLPLDVARQCFTLLVTGPEPVSVDGRDFAGLPPRAVPLDELRDRLMSPRCPAGTRDEVWAHLVQRSRDEGATWTLACAGVAVPALGGLVRWLCERYPGDRFDMEAEVLSGFLLGLATVDLSRPRVLVRLRWAAFRAGHAALCEALDAPTPVAPGAGFRSSAPQLPWGHPDLVLARAVAASVLTPIEADLISATRVGDMPLLDWAHERGMAPGLVYKIRRRAEHRLVAFLREQAQDSSPEDPSAETALNALAIVRSQPAPRPGRGHPDLVLAQAVAAWVLSPTEADLISATRVGDMPLLDWAHERGMAPGTAYKARGRAEHRLVAFLREQAQDSSPEDPSVETVLTNLGLVRSPHHSRRPSHSVTASTVGGPEESVEKSGTAVSKTGPKRGLPNCGGTLPAAPSSPSSEVPRCA